MKNLGFFEDIIKNGNAGWNFMHYPASNGIELPYQLYIPESFSDDKKYPILLFMHGMGSVGTDGTHIYQPQATALRQIEASEAYKNNVIILAPRHPKGVKWVNVERGDNKKFSTDINPQITDWLAAAEELLDRATEYLPADTSRIYGWGNSMGAFSLWFLCAEYPELFTAIVPVAGGGRPDTARILKDVAVFAAHGDADATVDYMATKLMTDGMLAAGAADAHLRTYKEKGHSIKDVFGPMGEDPEVVNWLFTRKKSAKML